MAKAVPLVFIKTTDSDLFDKQVFGFGRVTVLLAILPDVLKYLAGEGRRFRDRVHVVARELPDVVAVDADTIFERGAVTFIKTLKDRQSCGRRLANLARPAVSFD